MATVATISMKRRFMVLVSPVVVRGYGMNFMDVYKSTGCVEREDVMLPQCPAELLPGS